MIKVLVIVVNRCLSGLIWTHLTHTEINDFIYALVFYTLSKVFPSIKYTIKKEKLNCAESPWKRELVKRLKEAFNCFGIQKGN